MNSVTRTLFWIAGISIAAYGMMALATQLRGQEEINWIFIGICIGLGFGLPLITVIPYNGPHDDEKDYSEQCAQQSNSVVDNTGE